MRLVFELSAVARFYVAPEGASTLRKMLAFNAATTPAIEAALLVWALGDRRSCPAEILRR